MSPTMRSNSSSALTRIIEIIQVPGLYVEIKNAQFFMEDGSLDMSELFLDELATHPKASELLFDHVTLCDDLKHNEYRVPPLVVQSFEAEVLEKLRVGFKARWMEFVEEDELLSSGVVNATSESDDEIDHPWCVFRTSFWMSPF